MLQDSENMSFGLLEKARQNAQLWGHPNYHELFFPQMYQRSPPNAGGAPNLVAWQNQWTQSQINAATAAAAAASVNIRKSPDDHHHFDQQQQQQNQLNLERQLFQRSQEESAAIHRTSTHKHMPVRFNPYQIFSSSQSSSSPSPYVEASGQSSDRSSVEQLRDSPTSNWFSSSFAEILSMYISREHNYVKKEKLTCINHQIVAIVKRSHVFLSISTI